MIERDMPMKPAPDGPHRYECRVPLPALEPKQNVLIDAGGAVEERGRHYGTAIGNHGRTADLWSAFLGVTITARQVCMMNILQKVSREAHSAQRDNLVDIAGYARNAELIDEVMNRKVAP